MRYRISKYKHLHSNRFRYLSSSIPLVCASGLLVVFGMMIGPNSIRDFGSNGEAYADVTISTSGGSSGATSGSVSLSLVNPDVTNLQTSATSGTVAYITKDFTITSSNEYNIYVQTSTGNSNLTNGTSSIPSLTGSNIAPSSFSDNTWGYTVADNSPDPSTLTYSSVPTTSANAIKTGSNASNKAFRLAFAAKFGNNASAGHYRTNVVLSVAANPGEVTTLYSVIYNTNGSTGGVTPAAQTAESSSSTYTFDAPERGDLAKTGYGFVGWSEDANATKPQYKPGSTITLSAASPSKTLYATWGITLISITNMTELTSEICGNTLENETKQLIDTRDSKTYWVTKLKDGNCWMTQNLALNLNGRTLTPSDSDVASNWSGASGVSSAIWNGGGANVIKWYASNSGSGHGSYGNYYSWQAATAGTGSAASATGVAAGSICPKGWKLPTIVQIEEITKGTNGEALTQTPYYFTKSGRVNNGQTGETGTAGFYWSSTAINSNARYLYFTPSSLATDYGDGSRDRGHTLRCLALGS